MPKLLLLPSLGVPADLLDKIEHAPVPPLDAGEIARELQNGIDAWTLGKDRESDGGGAVGRPRRQLLEAALRLLAGDLDGSHCISQEIKSPEGSFWHGVMHRREGDYGNAQYWFRRVGLHPAYDELRKELADDVLTREVFRGGWDPVEFVDQCAAACRQAGRKSGLSQIEILRQAQWIEWQVMVKYCMS
jgi:hypothetical protein